jgi:hypothetical protein
MDQTGEFESVIFSEENRRRMRAAAAIRSRLAVHRVRHMLRRAPPQHPTIYLNFTARSKTVSHPLAREPLLCSLEQESFPQKAK